MSSTVAKALTLLDLFTESESEIGLSEMARRSGLDKATVHRMLGAMSDAGLLEQRVDSRLYRLGAGVLRLARVRETAFPIASVVEPVLERLTEKTGETSHASLISGRALADIGTCESRKGSRVSLVAGEILPFHCTASGLVALAHSPEAFTDRILAAPLLAKTPFTLTDPGQVRNRLDAIRKLGFAESDQTNEEEVHGTGAPLFDRAGLACGAVAVAAPSHRVTDATRHLTIPLVLAAAKEITEGLGGRWPKRFPLGQ